MKIAGSVARDLEEVDITIRLSNANEQPPRLPEEYRHSLCFWANVIQDGRVQCPPKKGLVEISAELVMPHWWYLTVSL